MKSKKGIELDVDIIGNQEPLTEKEKQAISDLFVKENGSISIQVGNIYNISKNNAPTVVGII